MINHFYNKSALREFFCGHLEKYGFRASQPGRSTAATGVEEAQGHAGGNFSRYPYVYIFTWADLWKDVARHFQLPRKIRTTAILTPSS
jgi:hypothetical protein